MNTQSIQVNQTAFSHLYYVEGCLTYFLNDPYINGLEQEFLQSMQSGSCMPFALSTGDMRRRRMAFREKFVEFTPSPTGLPTLRDADVLNYCASWLTSAAIDERQEDLSSSLRFSVQDFLGFSRRGKGGKQEEGLVQSLDRLTGSHIRTNTHPFFVEGEDETTSFSYLNNYQVKRNNNGGLESAVVELPGRFIRYATRPPAGSAMLHPDYLGLSNTRRAIYLIAVLFGGTRSPSSFAIDKLQKMIGSNTRVREFKQEMLKLQDQGLPEYQVEVDENSDLVRFIRLCDYTPEFV